MKTIFTTILMLIITNAAFAQQEKFYYEKPTAQTLTFVDTMAKYLPQYKYIGVDTNGAKPRRLNYHFRDTTLDLNLIARFWDNKKDYDPEMKELPKYLVDFVSIRANYLDLVKFIQSYTDLSAPTAEQKKRGVWYEVDGKIEYKLSRVSNSKKGYWTFTVRPYTW